MKYAIMSDIHGNLKAFKAAVADARKRGCGMMVCLGDLTGYGDQSLECVDFAMKTMDVCLMGNHDIVCCGKEEPLEFASNRNFDADLEAGRGLSAEAKAWLSSRPYVCSRPEFACAHSEFSSPSDWFYILQPKDAWQSLWTRSEQILFVGHTHIPRLMKIPANKVKQAQSFDEKEAIAGMMGLKEIKSKSCKIVPGARYVVNVGSVGLPRKGSRASYCVYDSRNCRLQLVFFKSDMK